VSSEDKNTLGIGIGRRDDAFSGEEAVRLFHQIVELKRQTGPREVGIAGGKDHAAEEALTKTSRLVDIICGWAIDHKIGLAVREVSILAEEIKDLATVEQLIDINADEVALERVGSLYPDDVTEKSHSGEITHAALAKILPLLFERFPSAIFPRVGTAFWLLSRRGKVGLSRSISHKNATAGSRNEVATESGGLRVFPLWSHEDIDGGGVSSGRG
jgi:hypothetical protein